MSSRESEYLPDMNTSRLKTAIIATLITAAACARPPKAGFGASSVRGEWMEFTGVEQGVVIIPEGAAARLFESDASGEPKYLTGDIVRWNGAGSEVSARPAHAMAVRFLVPQIPADDYVIISAEIEPPAGFAPAGGERVYQAAYRYSARYSLQKEYIFFQPHGLPGSGPLTGEWRISLYSGTIRVYSGVFAVR